jgi:hypothetical protein
MKRRSAYQRFMAMSNAQRDAEVAPFDREMAGIPGKALSKHGQMIHAKARRKGDAASRRRVISSEVRVKVAKPLLDRADAYAKQHGMNRSELVAKGLEALVGSAA